MKKTMTTLITGRNSSKIVLGHDGKPTINGVSTQQIKGHQNSTDSTVYNFTPQIYEALTSTGYIFKNINIDDKISFNQILTDNIHHPKKDPKSKRSQWTVEYLKKN